MLVCHVKLNFAPWLERAFLWTVLITHAGPSAAPARTNERLRLPACTNGHPVYCVFWARVIEVNDHGEIFRSKMKRRLVSGRGMSDNSGKGETRRWSPQYGI